MAKPTDSRPAWLRGAVLASVVLMTLVLALRWSGFSINRKSLDLDRRERDATVFLAHMEEALAGRDIAGLERFFSPLFRGKPLGLADLSREQLWELDDGRQIVPMRQVIPGAVHPAAAVAEWRRYLEKIEVIEGVRLSLEDLGGHGDSEMVAVVAFELMGTVSASGRGATPDARRSVVDRALIRLGFVYCDEGDLRLRRSSTIEGARTLTPQARLAETG